MESGWLPTNIRGLYKAPCPIQGTVRKPHSIPHPAKDDAVACCLIQGLSTAFQDPNKHDVQLHGISVQDEIWYTNCNGVKVDPPE